MRRVIVVPALVIAAWSCAGRSQRVEHRTSNNIVTREEIAAANVTTAYEALDRLRPMFLRRIPRSAKGSGSEYAVVFIDGVRRGSPDILRTVSASAIAEIRYLTASDATTHYGLDVDGGVIDVKLMHP